MIQSTACKYAWMVNAVCLGNTAQCSKRAARVIGPCTDNQQPGCDPLCKEDHQCIGGFCLIEQQPQPRQTCSPPQKCLKKVWRTTEVTSAGPTTLFAAARSTSAFWTRGFTEHVLKTAKDCSSCPVDLAEKATSGSSKPRSLRQAGADCCCSAT